MIKFPKAATSDSSSLTDWAYLGLRRGIITGSIPGGSRLVETALASQMNVSRTPVREALHKLALEGLLYSIPRAGYIVEELTDYDFQDLLTTRTAIEEIICNGRYEHRGRPEKFTARQRRISLRRAAGLIKKKHKRSPRRSQSTQRLFKIFFSVFSAISAVRYSLERHWILCGFTRDFKGLLTS